MRAGCEVYAILDHFDALSCCSMEFPCIAPSCDLIGTRQCFCMSLSVQRRGPPIDAVATVTCARAAFKFAAWVLR